jgi:hypothetical protein
MPPGHQTFLVTDDASAPHLRNGEYAVVHVVDRELQHGELYVVQNSSGERHRRITQARSEPAQTSPDQVPSRRRSISSYSCSMRKMSASFAHAIKVAAATIRNPQIVARCRNLTCPTRSAIFLSSAFIEPAS